jgi:FtsZ-binding cell division protein ZapB
MSEEDLKAEIEKLRAENDQLKNQECAWTEFESE